MKRSEDRPVVTILRIVLMGSFLGGSAGLLHVLSGALPVGPVLGDTNSTVGPQFPLRYNLQRSLRAVRGSIDRNSAINEGKSPEKPVDPILSHG